MAINIARRKFIAALGGAAAAWPLAALHAQQSGRTRRIGVLIGIADDAEGQARLGAFEATMRDLGWSEGGNMHLDARFTSGLADRAQNYSAELIALSPDVIVANTAAVVAVLQQKTRTVPIVFAQVVDAVNSGFVESLDHPGGNITGFVSFDYSIAAKWLDILKQIAPQITRIGVLRDQAAIGGAGMLGGIQAVAQPFGVELTALDSGDVGALNSRLEAFSHGAAAGLIVVANPGSTVHRDLIISIAAKYRLPTIYPYSYFTRSGGLISYGVDNSDLWRRAATYVDRILKGERPSDLPVQQPTKFDLSINLKTAKALGLAIPQSLLAIADEFIE